MKKCPSLLRITRPAPDKQSALTRSLKAGGACGQSCGTLSSPSGTQTSPKVPSLVNISAVIYYYPRHLNECHRSRAYPYYQRITSARRRVTSRSVNTQTPLRSSHKLYFCHLHRSYNSLNYIISMWTHGTPLNQPVARPHSQNINFQLYRVGARQHPLWANGENK